MIYSRCWQTPFQSRNNTRDMGPISKGNESMIQNGVVFMGSWAGLAVGGWLMQAIQADPLRGCHGDGWRSPLNFHYIEVTKQALGQRGATLFGTFSVKSSRFLFFLRKTWSIGKAQSQASNSLPSFEDLRLKQLSILSKTIIFLSLYENIKYWKVK